MTVSSGTAALHLACLAAGIGPGDEVIVPALTFVASANAARYVGAEPVLCDMRRRHRYDLNIDLEDVARRITPRTTRGHRGALLRLPRRRARAARALRRARPAS